MIPAMLLAAAMSRRVYMIQHDCLHRSFFSSRKPNDVVGTRLSPIAMTPHKATRCLHNLHHTHVSELDRRDTFETYVMILREWEAASYWKRVHYRACRSAITPILVWPFILYAAPWRVPLYGQETGIGDLLLHNALLAALVVTIRMFGGWPGLAVWISAVYLACVFGAFIPYVLHSFEHIHRGTTPALDFETVAWKAPRFSIGVRCSTSPCSVSVFLTCTT